MDHTNDRKPFEEKHCEAVEDVHGITAEWDATLIDTVRGYPHLYKKQSKNYQNKTIRDQSWSEIASTMKSSVEDCQRRWIRLRERFSRERKNRASEIKSGSESTNKRSFPLYEKMLFLADHVHTRRSFRKLSSCFDIVSTSYASAKKESPNRLRRIVLRPIASSNYRSDVSRKSTSTPLTTGTPATTSKQLPIPGGLVYTMTLPDTNVSEVHAALPSSSVSSQPISIPITSQRPALETTRTTSGMQSLKQPCGEFDAFAQWMATVLQRVPSTRVTKLMSNISKMVFEELDEGN